MCVDIIVRDVPYYADANFYNCFSRCATIYSIDFLRTLNTIYNVFLIVYEFCFVEEEETREFHCDQIVFDLQVLASFSYFCC